MKRLILFILLITSVITNAQIKVCQLPQVSSGTIHDWIIKEDSTCNGTRKITVQDFMTTYGITSSGSGSVASFSSGNLSPLFTSSVANSTTTPALSFSLNNANAHKWLGNATGFTGLPSYSSIDTTDISNFSSKIRGLFAANSPISYSNGFISADTSTGNSHLATQYYVSQHSGGGGGSGTVTSLTVNAPLTGGTITTSGGIGADTSTGGSHLATQAFVLNQITSGSSGAIAYTDITYSDALTAEGAGTLADGYYRITGTSAAGFYTRTAYDPSSSKFLLLRYGDINFINGSSVSLWAKGEIDLTIGSITELYFNRNEIIDPFIGFNQHIKSTDGTDVISSFIYVWGNSNWANIDLLNPTINFSGTADGTNCYIQNTLGSLNDVFSFKETGQFVKSLNAGSNRTIIFQSSFAGVGIDQCQVQNGYVIQVQDGSQVQKCAMGNRSSFRCTVDVSGLTTVDLSAYQGYGEFVFTNNSGTTVTLTDIVPPVQNGITSIIQVYSGETNAALITVTMPINQLILISTPYSWFNINGIATDYIEITTDYNTGTGRFISFSTQYQ